jgi:ABC-2 type transport system permease protein
MDVVLWGSLGAFVASQDETSRAAAPYLLAGIMLFWTLNQTQMTTATSAMEETWTRNLLNVLTTPVTMAEYLVALGLLGLAKVGLSLITLSLAAGLFYGFDLRAVGWSVIPIAGLLAVNGWALALVIIGLILRFGQSAEILTWGLNYLVMATSGVFFPVDALPVVMRPVANLLPTTHAFVAARSVIDGDPLPLDELALAAAGTAVALASSMAFCGAMMNVFRVRGFVTRYS